MTYSVERSAQKIRVHIPHPPMPQIPHLLSPLKSPVVVLTDIKAIVPGVGQSFAQMSDEAIIDWVRTNIG